MLDTTPTTSQQVRLLMAAAVLASARTVLVMGMSMDIDPSRSSDWDMDRVAAEVAETMTEASAKKV